VTREDDASLVHWREHAWLSGFFLATRLALQAFGFRFNFELDWMFLCDPSDLRARAFDCVYYFHAYPPGMNLLGSLLLKLGGSHAATLALVVFWAFGALLVNSLFYLLRELGLPLRPAFAVAAVFSVIPQTLYFEHLYLYEHLVASALTAACACLHYALKHRSTRAFAACFALCALIGWFRSTFHLIWFAAVLALALFFAGRNDMRRVLVAAAAPFVLLLALYVKNAALFGVFGTSSALGANLTRVTLDQLEPDVKQSWIANHEVSALAAVGVFSGPAAYLPFFPPRFDGRSPILDALERPTFHSSNFNHWVMLPVMRERRRDAAVYLHERPLEYGATVVHNVIEFFGPATRWHPRTGKPGSPHYEHAKVLGAYESAYNALVHWGWGVYVLLPLPCFGAWRVIAREAPAKTPSRRAVAAVLAFALLQIVYVTTLSALFTFGESARYRHQIEALIWLIAALSAVSPARYRVASAVRRPRFRSSRRGSV
jgi:hypothetical protein